MKGSLQIKNGRYHVVTYINKKQKWISTGVPIGDIQKAQKRLKEILDELSEKQQPQKDISYQHNPNFEYNTLFADFPDIMTIKDVQKALHISKNTAYKLITDGKIGHLKIGKAIRVPKPYLIGYACQWEGKQTYGFKYSSDIGKGKYVSNQGYVYFFKSNEKIKIGKSHNPQQRFRNIRSVNLDIEFLFAIRTLNMNYLELELHKKFAKHRIECEWFDLSKSHLNSIKTEYRQYISEWLDECIAVQFAE